MTINFGILIESIFIAFIVRVRIFAKNTRFEVLRVGLGLAVKLNYIEMKFKTQVNYRREISEKDFGYHLLY